MPADSAFLGGWTLQRFDRIDRNGRIDSPLGDHPSGLICYTREGAMSAHLVAGDGKPASGMACYTAYFGHFDVDESKGIVRHHVHSASVPGLAGTSQQREFKFSGDRLFLSTEFDGTRMVLEWKLASDIIGRNTDPAGSGDGKSQLARRKHVDSNHALAAGGVESDESLIGPFP